MEALALDITLRPPALVIADGIFETADQQTHSESLSQTELKTYLENGAFGEFCSWVMEDRCEDGRQPYTKFSEYSVEGCLTLEQLLPAVEQFLSEQSADTIAEYLRVCTPVVEKKDKANAERAAEKMAAELDEANAEKIQWGTKEVLALARAAFAHGDQMQEDGEVSLIAVQTFLSGSAYQHFGNWLTKERKPKSYFNVFAQGGASLTIELMRPAVQAYLSEFSIAPGLIKKDSPVGSELVSAQLSRKEHIDRQVLRVPLLGTQVRAEKHQTSPQDIEVVCAAILKLAGKNGEVSGNDLNLRLKGSPYEAFSKWALKGRLAPFKKYDVDGGGSICSEELVHLITSYLGNEMTTIMKQMTADAYRWRAGQTHLAAKRRHTKQVEGEAVLARAEGSHEVAADVQLKIRGFFARANKRRLLNDGKLKASRIAEVLYRTEFEDFGFWAASRQPNKWLGQSQMCVWYLDFQEAWKAATSIQAVSRSYLSRTNQKRVLAESLDDVQVANNQEKDLTLLCAPSGLALLAVVLASTSTLAQLILPGIGMRTTHGILAIQSFVNVRHSRLGVNHPETVSYAEQLAVAAAAVAVLHSLRISSEPEQALEYVDLVQQTLLKYELSKNAVKQLELLILEAQMNVRYRHGEYQKAFELSLQLSELGDEVHPLLAASYHMHVAVMGAAATGTSGDSISRIKTHVLSALQQPNTTALESHMLRGCSSSACLQVLMPTNLLQGVAQHNLAVLLVGDGVTQTSQAAQAACKALEVALDCANLGRGGSLLQEFKKTYQIAAQVPLTIRVSYHTALGHVSDDSFFEHLASLRQAHQCHLEQGQQSPTSMQQQLRPTTAVPSRNRVQRAVGLRRPLSRPQTSMATRGPRGVIATREISNRSPTLKVDTLAFVHSMTENIWWDMIM